jgi:hypothetical protein
MTLLADLTAAATPPSTPPAVVRTPTRPDGVLRRTDLVRLAVTLSSVGAVLAGLSLLAVDGGAADGSPVLSTPYGLIAVGRVSVDTSALGAARDGAAPAALAERVAVPVTLHNLSDEPVHYGPEHFRLRSGTATVRPEPGSVRSGDVAPGGAVQLRLVFRRGPAEQARLTVDVGEPATGLQLHLPPLAAAAPSS